MFLGTLQAMRRSAHTSKIGIATPFLTPPPAGRRPAADRIGLEVAVDNDQALALYTSVGFMPVTTEDYFELPLRSGP
jgi:hypothetical protein